MKILIISQEAWRDDTNGGNVLSNIFGSIDAEYAQIYCDSKIPDNHICSNYFQITDNMILKNILLGREIGNRLNINENNQEEFTRSNYNHINLLNKIKKARLQSVYIAREILWKMAKWENNHLNEFINKFNPDIIFAPCYGQHFMLAITRYVSELTNKPVISYISDDHYSLKRISFSPLFWINRFALRRNLRKTFPHYKLIYTMTEEQKVEYEEIFNCKMKILRKGIDISTVPKKNNINEPIRLIYAGGVYLGRWKTLSQIAKVIRTLNDSEILVKMDIYTGNTLSTKQKKLLDNGLDSFVHNSICQEKLKKEYAASDIALHVESFDIFNRLKTRLSFSTKITDCLSSGCSVMAICWENQAGYRYLNSNNAAICIDNLSDVFGKLEYILNDKGIILDYSLRAYEICEKNHSFLEIKKMLEEDFKSLVAE